MEIARTGRLIVDIDSGVDEDMAAHLALALEWLTIELEVQGVGTTGRVKTDRALKALLANGQIRLKFQLDQPPNLLGSEWLGEKQVGQFLYYHRGFSKTLAGSTTMRWKISRALAVFAAAHGVAVICSVCRQSVASCDAYESTARWRGVHRSHPCYYSEPLVVLGEIGKLRGIEPDLSNLNHVRTVETFQAYLEYLLAE